MQKCDMIFLACVFRGTPARFEKEAIKAKVEPPVGVEPTSAELEVRDVFLYHYSGAQLFIINLLFQRAYILDKATAIWDRTHSVLSPGIGCCLRRHIMGLWI